MHLVSSGKDIGFDVRRAEVKPQLCDLLIQLDKSRAFGTLVESNFKVDCNCW